MQLQRPTTRGQRYSNVTENVTDKRKHKARNSSHWKEIYIYARSLTDNYQIKKHKNAYGWYICLKVHSKKALFPWLQRYLQSLISWDYKKSTMSEIVSISKQTPKKPHVNVLTWFRATVNDFLRKSDHLILHTLDSNFVDGVIMNSRVKHTPQESHLLIFLLIITDDLWCGHAHLYPIDKKLPGFLQCLPGEVLRDKRGQDKSVK